MNFVAILGLGFFLGVRHATDADHVVAVSAIVSRERTLRAALPIGVLWGVGHTITIFFVGGVIILFGVVIPLRMSLALELCVALMLVLLGAWNIGLGVRPARVGHEHEQPAHAHTHGGSPSQAPWLRPLCVGIVHGLAGQGRRPWGGTYHDWREVSGMRVPFEAMVTWQLESGPFTYAHWLVETMDYDVTGP